MTAYERNMQMIRRRLDAGLERLRRDYTVRELDAGDLKSMTVAGRYHEVSQYEIEGVGNLLVMTNPLEGKMQMDTFTITPYFKNLPLFTTDYMYFEEKRAFLNEIYSLVDVQDALYLRYIDEFAANVKEHEALPDMPMKPCWYDSIRPVVAAKSTLPEQDDEIFALFMKNLETFIRMEKESPLLDDASRAGKWMQNHEYARRLVEDGGVSTALFVKDLGEERTKRFFYSVFFAPDLYRVTVAPDIPRLASFFSQRDGEGVSNADKIRANQKIIRRVASTDKNKSFEAVDGSSRGIVIRDGKTVGFGIDILNEDVYPLQSFEIYLRGCGLTGELDLSASRDLIFVDIYRNGVSSVVTGELPALRILGVQDNRIEALDVTGMPACQGIDAGKNLLKTIDVSKNPELVELYVNDNRLASVDLSANPKLKYFYCHNNRLRTLDCTANPLLRHIDCTGNLLREVRAWAPQNDSRVPLTLIAEEGGHIGLRCNPVYNAQWKETGEWKQTYFAYPEKGFAFAGWYDETGRCFSQEPVCEDVYGSGRELTARFLIIER